MQEYMTCCYFSEEIASNDKLLCIFLRQILGYCLYVCQKGGECFFLENLPIIQRWLLEVMGSIPIEDLDFELSDACDAIDITSFYFLVVI